ncbi:hypothetical protein SEA_BITESIZE_41 [Gordonia phage BiteSize]|uniref:Uncharacterized protein n=1 Tax=Gordonia phage BiteSize TaxID=2759394 RepID=A0A7L7SJY7_9CAUD|nr:hypothetical protein SEA_BITESIZE_41 [Gordonia phage BiteSize]
MGKVKINLDWELTEEFVGDVLVTAFDGQYGGSLFWASWSNRTVSLEKIEGPNFTADVWTAAWITFDVEESCDDKPHMKMIYSQAMEAGGLKIDSDMIAAGISGLLAKAGPTTRRTVLEAIVSNDAGDIDANIADSIVQYAIFGEEVYA